MVKSMSSKRSCCRWCRDKRSGTWFMWMFYCSTPRCCVVVGSDAAKSSTGTCNSVRIGSFTPKFVLKRWWVTIRSISTIWDLIFSFQWRAWQGSNNWIALVFIKLSRALPLLGMFVAKYQFKYKKEEDNDVTKYRKCETKSHSNDQEELTSDEVEVQWDRADEIWESDDSVEREKTIVGAEVLSSNAPEFMLAVLFSEASPEPESVSRWTLSVEWSVIARPIILDWSFGIPPPDTFKMARSALGAIHLRPEKPLLLLFERPAPWSIFKRAWKWLISWLGGGTSWHAYYGSDALVLSSISLHQYIYI